MTQTIEERIREEAEKYSLDVHSTRMRGDFRVEDCIKSFIAGARMFYKIGFEDAKIMAANIVFESSICGECSIVGHDIKNTPTPELGEEK